MAMNKDLKKKTIELELDLMKLNTEINELDSELLFKRIKRKQLKEELKNVK